MGPLAFLSTDSLNLASGKSLCVHLRYGIGLPPQIVARPWARTHDEALLIHYARISNSVPIPG